MEEEVDSLSTYFENTTLDPLDSITLQEIDQFIGLNTSSPPVGKQNSTETPSKIKTEPNSLHNNFLDPATYLTPNNSSNSLVGLEENAAKLEPSINFEVYEQVDFDDQDSESEEEKPFSKQTQLQPGQRHHRTPSEIEVSSLLFQDDKDLDPALLKTLQDMNRNTIDLTPPNFGNNSRYVSQQKPVIVSTAPTISTLSALSNSSGFRPGHSRNASTSSISSTASNDDESERSSGYSSSDLDEVDSFSFPGLKKYRQPITMRGLNLSIGPWHLKDTVKNEDLVSFEVKFLFGRRKIKYEIGNRSKSKANFVIEYTFSQICGLDVTPEKRLIVIELSEPPLFTAKERGKYAKIPDFTDGSATVYPRHHIEVLTGNFDEFLERLRTCDKRLRQLAKQGLPTQESTFPPNVIERASTIVASPVVTCDWDNENNAIYHCEDCNANYCSVCDDVLHRNANKKGHSRVTLDISSSPKSKKNKKRKKSDRCRCGTGATKGTLGEPCTGQRCPCFSNGRSCDACGCKNCSNPIKKKTGAPLSPAITSDSSPIIVPSGIAMIPIVNAPPPTTISSSESPNNRQTRSVSM